ncbi:MAG: response regulator [Pseudomonadota bacterium]
MATILIMDEEADSRMLLKRVLELNGHQVTACRDPEEALAQATERPFDLAVLNIPTGSGRAAGLPAGLRASVDGLKVMTIADYGPHRDAPGVMEDDVLFRPVELEAIEAKVRELLPSEE